MAKLSDIYGATGSGSKKAPSGGGAKGVGSRKSARTAGAVSQARAAVAVMAPAGVRFLMKISAETDGWLEAERARRGLRSRIATIDAIIQDARK